MVHEPSAAKKELELELSIVGSHSRVHVDTGSKPSSAKGEPKLSTIGSHPTVHENLSSKPSRDLDRWIKFDNP